MRGTRKFSIDAVRGVNLNTSPRLVRPGEALVAANARFGTIYGGVEKIGGRSRLAWSAFENPVLGLFDARFSTGDFLIGCSTTEVKKIENKTIGDPYFMGTGLDDLANGGNYTQTGNSKAFRVQIDGTGSPDTFKWSSDGGASWDQQGLSMTGSEQTLTDGVTVTFGATTGHTLNDRWDFMADYPWVTSNIRRAAYSSNCPSTRRWSYVMLDNKLIMSDYAVTGLEKWTGSGLTSALGITGSGLSTLKARYLAAFGDILLLAHTDEDSNSYPNRVRWSDGGDPESWTSTSFADLGWHDGDVVTGITRQQNILVVFKRESIWAGAYVGAPDYFVFEKMVEGRGAIAPFSIIAFGNHVYFMSDDGLYLYDGGPIPRRVSGFKQRQLIDSLTEETAMQIVSTIHPEKQEIWLSTDQETHIYNYLTDDWSKSAYIHGFTSKARRLTQRETWNSLAGKNITWDSTPYSWDTAFYKNGPVTFVGGDSNGDLLELDVGLDDIGNAQDFQYKTQFMDCGSPQQWKRFVGVKLKVAAYDATLTIDLYADGKTSPAATRTVTVNSQQIYSEIAGGFTEAMVYFNLAARFLSIRVRNNNMGENVRLYGFTLYYVPREAIK